VIYRYALGVRDDALVLWLRLLAAHRCLSETCERALQPFNLALPEYEVLQRVAQAGERGVRMQDLARLVLLTESGLTRLVTRLEGRGLLSRRPSPDDQRGRLCGVAPAGVALVRSARPRFLRALEGALDESALTGPERTMLGRLLGKIATTPDADEHAASGGAGAGDRQSANAPTAGPPRAAGRGAARRGQGSGCT
jgi:DNA-binding MarR family transcriptional regulator